MSDWRTAQCPPGVSRRILLLRHGETDASSRGRCYGKLDVPLSEEGRQQVERAATLLHTLSPDAIVSSPRTRALDSAGIVAKRCQLSVQTEERFAELDFGDFEGKRYEDVEREDPDFYTRWMASPTEVSFPNGESYSRMAQRVVAAYQQRVQNAASHKVLLVAHGGVNRIILSDVLDLDPAHVFRLEQSYAGISIIDYYDTTPVLRVMNVLA